MEMYSMFPEVEQTNRHTYISYSLLNVCFYKAFHP